jgi:hypothetical protein
LLTIRHFFLGGDVALGRTWDFHDHLYARPGVDYRLHLIGDYPGSPEDLDRPYIERGRPPLATKGSEVWIIRGWNHPLLTVAACAARFQRVPTLMWAERPGLTYETTNLKDYAKIRLRRFLLPLLFLPFRKDTLVLGTGDKAVEVFRELSQGSPGKLFPYPSSLADACLEKTSSAKRRSRETSGGEDALPLLLFLGSFTRRKAVDLIAESCQAAWAAGARFRIRYVGAGPLKDRLEEHVRCSGGRAELEPFADRDALLAHLMEADALLLPSRHDGWGLTVQEGLAAGLPVVTSDACGAAILVERSECGRVVPAGDGQALSGAISWVADLTIHEREEIRDRALHAAQGLTIPRLAETLLSYCKEALRFTEKEPVKLWASGDGCNDANGRNLFRRTL